MPYPSFSNDITGSIAGTVNTSLDGVFLGEGCSPGNVNAGLRLLAANIKQLSEAVPSTAAFATKVAAVFEGTQPRFASEGAMIHNANPSHASGRVYLVALGAGWPVGAASGDMLLEY